MESAEEMDHTVRLVAANTLTYPDYRLRVDRWANWRWQVWAPDAPQPPVIYLGWEPHQDQSGSQLAAELAPRFQQLAHEHFDALPLRVLEDQAWRIHRSYPDLAFGRIETDNAETVGIRLSHVYREQFHGILIDDVSAWTEVELWEHLQEVVQSFQRMRGDQPRTMTGADLGNPEEVRNVDVCIRNTHVGHAHGPGDVNVSGVTQMAEIQRRAQQGLEDSVDRNLLRMLSGQGEPGRTGPGVYSATPRLADMTYMGHSLTSPEFLQMLADELVQTPGADNRRNRHRLAAWYLQAACNALHGFGDVPDPDHEPEPRQPDRLRQGGRRRAISLGDEEDDGPDST